MYKKSVKGTLRLTCRCTPCNTAFKSGYKRIRTVHNYTPLLKHARPTHIYTASDYARRHFQVYRSLLYNLHGDGAPSTLFVTTLHWPSQVAHALKRTPELITVYVLGRSHTAMPPRGRQAIENQYQAQMAPISRWPVQLVKLIQLALDNQSDNFSLIQDRHTYSETCMVGC